LFVIAVVVLLALLAFRRISPAKWRWWYFIIPLFLAVAAFGIDRLIQTDLEKIRAVIDRAEQAVKEENAAMLAGVISDSYRDSLHGSKETLMNSFKARFSEPLVEKTITRIASIDIEPSVLSATAIFTVRVVFEPQSYVYDFKREALVKVELDLRKEPARRQSQTEVPPSKITDWRIRRAELLELDLHPTNWRDVEQSNW